MKKGNVLNNGIPVSVSLNPFLEAENFQPRIAPDKKRLLYIGALAVATGVMASAIAKLLIYLIALFTNLAFFGKFSFANTSPSENHLGIFVIVVPVLGGLIVGLMALYGSKAIRGHGIPEAMEQILTNQSRIKPSITYLKPLSSAISIGTGGPFGAEGPIIATGGALGSTLGQISHITHNERKILLAAGATAGMAAIFGSPVAAIFLAIELLLFEFSPRSIIPVVLACITGAAGHHLLFEAGPVFPMPQIATPGNIALFSYSALGIFMGLASALVTKAVYFIEDLFEKIPLHWMWWPAIGGLAVGIVGYYAPKTLGVGYENITQLLSGSSAMQLILTLCILKFISWAIALGSGTSGGTLAPLLTIGGATGALLGMAMLHFFPGCGISIPLAALTGMAAMFAGASRALLTSIIFALETTGCSQAILPLLASCAASYIVSFFFMRNTIMTEKIARRGVLTPNSFEPDPLEKMSVAAMMSDDGIVFDAGSTIEEIRQWMKQEALTENYLVITDENGIFRGIISMSNLQSEHHIPTKKIGELIKRSPATVSGNDSLRKAAELMAKENIDVVPVTDKSGTVTGILSYRDILAAYGDRADEHVKHKPNISLRRKGMKILLRGQKVFRR